jgi:hypothetical protein
MPDLCLVGGSRPGSITGPSHYAALILSESTYSGRKSEVQSRGFSHSDHSGKDARSFNAGDSVACSARQTNVYCYRRSHICATQGNRELQTERSRKAEGQVHKETQPLAKIKIRLLLAPKLFRVYKPDVVSIFRSPIIWT